MAASSKRLFVGGLSESVDEYTLIKFLSKHGKISKFDYLFHKAGPKQGRPRGYAFVEYATAEEALRTMIELDGKLLLGRRVAIKRANDAPPEHASGTGPWRKDAPKHTTLSLLKGHTKPESRESKMRALERKLLSIDSEKAATSAARESSISEAEGTPEPRNNDQSQNEGDGDEAPVAGPSGTSIHTAGKAARAPVQPTGLPLKPDQTTIDRGERERRAKEKDEHQKATDLQQQHRQPPSRRDKQKKAEAPRSTLASLGVRLAR